jgi:hypothetical protein
MDLKETQCEDVDWIKLAQVQNQWWAFVNTVMYAWFQEDGTFSENLIKGSAQQN